MSLQQAYGPYYFFVTAAYRQDQQSRDHLPIVDHKARLVQYFTFFGNLTWLMAEHGKSHLTLVYLRVSR